MKGKFSVGVWECGLVQSENVLNFLKESDDSVDIYLDDKVFNCFYCLILLS